MRRRLALLLVVVLVTAGCGSLSGGTGTGPASPAPEATPSETPRSGGANATLPVDAKRVFERTAALLGAPDATAPQVRVREPAAMTVRPEAPAFLARLGVRYGDRAVTVDASAGGGVVRLSRGALNRSDLRYVLAHEFTHALQQGRQNFSRRFYASVETRGLGVGLLQRSIAEGAATYAGNRYWRAHVGETPTPATRLSRSYAETDDPAVLYSRAPYYFGYRYLAERNVSPANLTAVYDDPPRTTEELVHGLPPGSEPPAPLTVTVEGGTAEREGRVGELATRLALRSELNRSAAAAAAAGWGEDRLLRFPGEPTNYVWVLRWDDRANATEFERAARRYLDRRGTPTASGWRDEGVAFQVRRLAPRTTALVTGEPGFVSTVTVEGNVSVTVRRG